MQSSNAGAVILAALEGTALTAEEKSCFQEATPAGFTLFRRNLAPEFASVRSLNRELQSLHLTLPMMIAIDQEGGRVARLRSPFPLIGPALEMAEGGRDEAALLTLKNHGFVQGASLLGLGVNANFAPVLDILTREENVAIGDRCFARDAEGVTLRAGAYLRGLNDSGVLSCVKHFPGQGDASLDTHESGTVISLSYEELWDRELVPFRALLSETPMLMISHVLYSALDPAHPASLSSAIMEGLVRGRLAYKGVIVTDDMNMKAIDQAREPWCEAVLSSIAAGADLVLVCRELERYCWAVEAIDRELRRSPAFEKRWQEARRRVSELRSRLRH
jgi:beta-N-acetylhexosaminidase